MCKYVCLHELMCTGCLQVPAVARRPSDLLELAFQLVSCKPLDVGAGN